MALVLTMYPRSGAVVLDEEGNVIPTSGARVTFSAYYENLCRRGDLLLSSSSETGASELVIEPISNAPEVGQALVWNGTSAVWCTTGGEVSVSLFGIVPDGTDCTSAVNALIADLAAASDRPVIELYFPKGARSYRFSGPILPPTVDTAESTAIRLIVRGDRGEGASQAAYGDPTYTNTTFYTGTSLQFDAGEVGFDLWQGGDVRTALSLRDLCVQGSGAGSVGVDMYGDGSADSVVRFDAESVTLAGFETGIALYTFQPMRCPGLRTYGHSEHVRVRGVATCWISDSEHQGGDDVFVFDQALNMAIRGFLIQGTTGSAIKVNDVGSVGVRAVHFSDGHIETTGKTIEDDPNNLNKTVRIRITDTRIAQLTPANTFNLYGGGWDIEKSCSGMVITATSYDFRLRSDDGDFSLSAGSDAQYEIDSQYRRLVTLGLPQSDLAVSGGNLVYDAVVAGSFAAKTLSASVNLVTPTNLPFGKLMCVLFTQNGTGGYTVTPVGLGLGTEWTLGMTGNVANARAWLLFTRDTQGGTVGQQCRLIYWSGWRV